VSAARSGRRPAAGPARSVRLLFLLALAAGPLARGVPAQSAVAVWRMNCGGPQAVTADAPPFLADQPYTTATHGGYEGGAANASKPGGDLGPLLDPHVAVHDTARLGWKSYRFEVANGSYLLRLHFAEIDQNVQGPTLRHFSAAVEGAPLLLDFDPAATLGVRFAGELVVPVTVADGRLDLTLIPGGTPAILNAIEVWRLPPGALPPPPPVKGLAAKEGYGRTIVSWTSTTIPTVMGWIVSRAESPDGPYADVATTWALPSRLLDTSAPLGVPVWYRVAARGPDGARGPAAQAGPATARAPLQGALPVYELAVAPADLVTLDVMVLVDEEFEVPAVFRHAGVDHDVSVRYRGGGSLLASKKSWKVDFPDGDLFDGRRKLNLKASFLDESLCVEPLAHGLFESIGQHVSRTRPVHLFVNGADRGMFRDVEQVDERWLAARDRAPGGSIYKGVKGKATLALASLADYQTYYEKKTNESTGYDDLVALIELLNAPGTSVRQLADVFDLEGYLDYLSVIGWTGDADQGARNFYLLHDHGLGRWEWITWDNDRSLFDPQSPIDGATSTCEVCSGYNHLKEFVLKDPGMRWRYGAKLLALMEGAASPAAFADAVAARHAEVAADASADTAKEGWERDDLFVAAPGVQTHFAPARAAFVTAELASYMPASPPTHVWINELMADNVATLADGNGAFGDWVELYNADAAPFDASGLYLTADLSHPTAWRLRAGTVLPPHGRLLVWCDGHPAAGPLHASFTLDAHGGELALIAADGDTLLDVVDFVPQLPDISLGRRTDGAAYFALLPTPTPLAPNTTAGNLPPAVSWVEHTPLLPSPADEVSVTALVTDPDAPLDVTLFWRAGAAGAFVAAPMLPLEEDRWEAHVPRQPAGTAVQYWVSATDGAGAHASDPTAAPAEVFTWGVPDPPPTGLFVSEFLADNAATLQDEAGSFEDWVEIGNESDAVADLSGLCLTDDPAKPTQWSFPPGTLLAPHARLLVWADEDPQDGPLHAAFKLSKSGETVALFDSVAHGNGLLDAIAFGPQLTDVSTGRLPQWSAGSGAAAPGLVVSLLDPSPGQDNAPATGATSRYDALLPASTSVSLAPQSPAQAGAAFTLTVQSAPGSAAGLLVAGITLLHADLGAQGVLLVYPLLPLAVPFTTGAGGGATTALALPANAALAGLLIEVQAYVTGAGLSNAVVARIAPAS